jgi:hypothetical protein
MVFMLFFSRFSFLFTDSKFRPAVRNAGGAAARPGGVANTHPAGRGADSAQLNPRRSRDVRELVVVVVPFHLSAETSDPGPGTASSRGVERRRTIRGESEGGGV